MTSEAGETTIVNEYCAATAVGENESENEDESENDGDPYSYEYTYETGKYRYAYTHEYVWSPEATQNPDPGLHPAPTVISATARSST